MKKNHETTAAAGIVSLLAVGIASAGTVTETAPVEPSNESGIVGHIGLSTGMNFVRETQGSSPDEGDIWFGALDASITVPLGASWLAAFDGYARYDDFQSEDDFDSDEDPDWEYMLGGHFLMNVAPDTRAGLFFGYGDTRPQDGDSSDAYDVWMIGFEGHHFLTEDLMVYAQLGYGFKGRDGDDDDEGFNEGLIGRVGAAYFMSERSTINFDLEMSGVDNYIDSDDPGRFFGVTLNYQYQLSETLPLYFSCFGRYDHINSTDEGDHVDEWQVGIGIKYVFGAGSQRDATRKGASIGLPRLPTRASAYTEYID